MLNSIKIGTEHLFLNPPASMCCHKHSAHVEVVMDLGFDVECVDMSEDSK